MARKKLLTNEGKRERFLRLANNRTRDALNRLRILGNCANRSVYEYSQEDVDKIFDALKEQLKGVEAKFHFPKHKEFKL